MRPTTAPIAPAATVASAALDGRGGHLDRDERAGQHHRLEAEVDEAADPIDEAADRREQDRRRHQHRRVKEEIDHGATLWPAQPKPNCATAKIMTAPCRISTISIGTLLNNWMVAPAEDSAPKQNGGERDPDRGIAREQRDRDAGEAVAGREAGDEAMNEAEHMNAAGEAADHARGDHHAHKYARTVDSDSAAESAG